MEGLSPGLTADGGPLWQDGDGADCSVFQLLDRTVLGPPTVRTDPQEVADLIRSLRGIQDSSGWKHNTAVRTSTEPLVLLKL